MQMQIGAAALAMAMLSSTAVAADDGEITLVMPGGPQTMDACQASTTNTGRIIKQNILEALTQINPTEGGAAPRLATSWEQDEDGSWIFHIREGVTFHDGTPLTNEAIIYSFERMLDPALGCDALIFAFSGVAVEVEEIDATTIRIITEPVQPILPLIVEGLPIVSLSTPRNEMTREPIGTGPYSLADWDTQTSVTLDRYDGYWGEQPDVVKATFVWREEATVRAAMVDLGEADFALAIGEQSVREGDIAFPTAELTRIKIANDQPPFDDVRVRMALNYALDRQALIGTILNPDLTLANQIVGPSVFGYNPEIGQYLYDPEAARRLLDEARADGVPVDRPIRMISLGGANNFANADDVRAAFISMWHQVGLEVTNETMEIGLFRESIRRENFEEGRAPTLAFSNHDNTTGDAGMSIYSKYHSGNMTADIPSDPADAAAQDAMIERGMAAIGDERREIFQEILRLQHDVVVPEVWLYYMVNVLRLGDRISYEPNARTNTVIELADITFN